MIQPSTFDTYSEYRDEAAVHNLRVKLLGEGTEVEIMAEWEWLLLFGPSVSHEVGMTLTAETDSGIVTITDVRPDSVIMKELRVEHADGTWGKEYVLSCEEVSGDRIRYVPGVVQWWTQ